MQIGPLRAQLPQKKNPPHSIPLPIEQLLRFLTNLFIRMTLVKSRFPPTRPLWFRPLRFINVSPPLSINPPIPSFQHSFQLWFTNQ